MESDRPAEDGFLVLGTYSPHEAKKLLACFERDGIAFRAQPQKSGYYLSTEIVVRVEPQRAGDAAKIHRELFGDALPNYDSSFFREHRNVEGDKP
jgi:hypothetical protein